MSSNRDTGSQPSKRMRLSRENFEQLTKEELINGFAKQQDHIRELEAKLEIITGENAEDKFKTQLAEANRRENVLVMRLATKEQEVQDYVAQIAHIKKAQVDMYSKNLQESLLDPSVNLLFNKMKDEVRETKDKLQQAQSELSAWKFTPDSQTGKKLMSRCRTLIAENKDLGQQISQGKVAQLEAELALQKKFSEELKQSQDELNEFVIQLDEEVEGMQSTIQMLQHHLINTKKDLEHYKKIAKSIEYETRPEGTPVSEYSAENPDNKHHEEIEMTEEEYHENEYQDQCFEKKNDATPEYDNISGNDQYESNFQDQQEKMDIFEDNKSNSLQSDHSRTSNKDEGYNEMHNAEYSENLSIPSTIHNESNENSTFNNGHILEETEMDINSTADQNISTKTTEYENVVYKTKEVPDNEDNYNSDADAADQKNNLTTNSFQNCERTTKQKISEDSTVVQVNENLNPAEKEDENVDNPKVFINSTHSNENTEVIEEVSVVNYESLNIGNIKTPTQEDVNKPNEVVQIPANVGMFPPHNIPISNASDRTSPYLNMSSQASANYINEQNAAIINMIHQQQLLLAGSNKQSEHGPADETTRHQKQNAVIHPATMPITDPNALIAQYNALLTAQQQTQPILLPDGKGGHVIAPSGLGMYTGGLPLIQPIVPSTQSIVSTDSNGISSTNTLTHVSNPSLISQSSGGYITGNPPPMVYPGAHLRPHTVSPIPMGVGNDKIMQNGVPNVNKEKENIDNEESQTKASS